MGLDQSLFLQRLNYTVAAPVAEILQDMEAIAQLDQAAEKKQKFWTAVGISCLIGGFLGLVLVGLGGPVALILLIPAMTGLLIARHHRINLESYRYTLIKRLVTMLERDMEPGAVINANLLFSSATDKSKKVETIPHEIRSGWKVDLFEDNWLKLRGRFTDNTRFQLLMTDRNQTAYGWQRNPRGKNKYKSKSKTRGSAIALTLNCSMRKYGALKALQDSHSAIQLPPGVQIKRFQVTDKGLHLSVKAAPDTSAERETTYQTITMMFLSLYQILNLARMLSKPKSAQGAP